MATPSMHSVWRLVVLACILLVYVFNVERWHPELFFGQFQDDSIYFSTAKALSDGEGYTLISFPGSPPQTKYPIVYPWLLSHVWKLNPTFPDNLKPAIHLMEFFGCWTLIACFFLLRKLSGVGGSAALLLTGLCAFQPVLVRMGGLLMSDMPFTACMLTVLAIGVSTESRTSFWIYLLLGALAGLSVGIRTIGIALVAGIFIALIFKKSFRPALVFIFAASTVIVLVMWPTLFHRAVLGSGPSDAPGWDQVAAYYTNYVRFQWTMGVPSLTALLRLMLVNFVALVSTPGTLVIDSLGRFSYVAAALCIPIWIGLLRQYRHAEWRFVELTLCLYGCVMLVWPYPQSERFLLPFIPIILAALYCEIYRLGALTITEFRSGSSASQRIPAGVFVCITAYLFGLTAWNCLFRDSQEVQIAIVLQLRVLAERKEAYQWIREHTSPSDRVAAWKDAVLYLYTGRQSLRPLAILPQAFYADDVKSEQRDLAHICDAPKYAGVHFWVTTSEDFNLEAHKDRVAARMSEISAVLPIVFRSSAGHVQIHDASCLNEQNRPDCREITPTLFPK